MLEYIADSNNFRIRMVDTNQTITTFAGNGAVKAAGDNGPASKAALSVNDLTVFGGSLYFADTANHKIRKIAGPGRDFFPVISRVVSVVVVLARSRNADTMGPKVTTFAGGSRAGFSNGFGQSALFNSSLPAFCSSVQLWDDIDL